MLITEPALTVAYLPPQPLPRSIKFDPWRIPRTKNALMFIQRLEKELTEDEERQRKRRPVDQAIFQAQLGSLGSHLAMQVIDLDERFGAKPTPIAIIRSKRHLCPRSRYKPPSMTAAFRNVVDSFDGEGWITQELGKQRDDGKAIATLLHINREFCHRVWEAGLERADFGRGLPAEPIMLRAIKEDRFDRGAFVDYPESEHTRQLRAEVTEVNQWIAEADLRFDQGLAEGQLIDTSDRNLRRIFWRNSFETGGRLFGGFWQKLSKAQRKAGLRINGEAIVALDYGQMILRMAYGREGLPLPSQSDLYAIPGYEDHREGIKKLIAALLFKEKPCSRFPNGTKSLMPAKQKVGQVVSAIRQVHQGIAHLFYKAIGHELMHMESLVLMAVLKELREKSIVALPVHSSLRKAMPR